MTDAYRAQYREAEDPFSQWFFEVWRTSNRGRIVDEEVENVWRRILGHINVEHLRVCHEDYLRQSETSGLPSPGRILAIYRKRKDVRDAKVEQKKQPRRQALSAREKAWRKAQAALAKRMVDMTIDTPASGYDPTEIVEAVMLKDFGPEPVAQTPKPIAPTTPNVSLHYVSYSTLNSLDRCAYVYIMCVHVEERKREQNYRYIQNPQRRMAIRPQSWGH